MFVCGKNGSIINDSTAALVAYMLRSGIRASTMSVSVCSTSGMLGLGCGMVNRGSYFVAYDVKSELEFS